VGQVLGAATHGVNNHRVVSVGSEHADFEQVPVASGTDAHHEVVIEAPLRDGIADGVQRVFVSDSVTPRGLRDSHGDKIPCRGGPSHAPRQCAAMNG